MKEETLQEIADLFKRFGIKSQTMDDIARHLGISKKTLYKSFSDKNDLVLKTLRFLNHRDCEHMDEVREKELNAIDENYVISKHVLDQFRDIHPSVWYDLKRYHPEAMKEMDEFMEKEIYQWVCENLQKGIEQGLYRDDLKIPIIAGIYISRIKDFFNPMVFDVSRYSFVEIYVETFRYHIRGIATEKGLTALQERVKKEKTTKNEFQ